MGEGTEFFLVLTDLRGLLDRLGIAGVYEREKVLEEIRMLLSLQLSSRYSNWVHIAHRLWNGIIES